MQSLFPEPKQTVEERIQRIDGEILQLLCGKPGGHLGLTLTDNQKRVLGLVRYRRGSARAMTIREMQMTIKSQEKQQFSSRLTDREIKQAVRALRMEFHVPVGSSKHGSDGGYFIMVSDEDHGILRGQILDQVRAELAVLRAVDGPQATLELLGQLQLEAQS
jgi:hypothetical protein